MCGQQPTQELHSHTLHHTHGAVRAISFICIAESSESQNRCRNSDGSIHRPSGCVLAHCTSCTIAAKWTRKLENECKATGGGILSEPNTTGMDKVGKKTEGETSGQCDVVRKLCQKEKSDTYS